MKIKVKKGIAIIEIEEGDNSSSGDLKAVADEMKQSITGLNAIVAELSNIVLNGLHEQVTALTTNVQMLSTSVTMVTEKFQTIFQSYSSISVINSYNQYITMPCPPGSGGEGKKDDDESFFKIFKDLYEAGKDIYDLFKKIKNEWNLEKAIKGGNPEEIEAAENVIEKDAMEDAIGEAAEGIGEVLFGEVGEVLAGLFVALDPAVWIIAGVALAGAGIYEYYKHKQDEEGKKAPETTPVPQGSLETKPMEINTYPNSIENNYPLLGNTDNQQAYTNGLDKGPTVSFKPFPEGNAVYGTNPNTDGSTQGGYINGNGVFMQSPSAVGTYGVVPTPAGPAAGTGAGSGSGNRSGGGLPCPPMPCLCEEIRECLQGNSMQAMPMFPMNSMNSNFSSMKISYSYSFGTLANFSGKNTAVAAPGDVNIQSQFWEVLQQAISDVKVSPDVH